MFHVEHSRLACVRNAGRVRPRPRGLGRGGSLRPRARVCPLPAFLKLPRSPGAGAPAPRLLWCASRPRARRGLPPCGCLLPPCLLAPCSLLAGLLRVGLGCPLRGRKRGVGRALRFSSCLRAFFSLLKGKYYITIVI